MKPPITLSTDALDRLAAELVEEAGESASERLVLGIAGIPGSGKSTLALQLVEHINAIRPRAAALAPMDGFHLPNSILRKRNLIESKGAPATFDADAYIRLLERCRDASVNVTCPRYDRTVHEPVRDDHPLYRAGRATRIVITEGNYLLMNKPPWSGLRGILTSTWWIDTPIETARRWLMQRHTEVGRSLEEAERRYANDLANTHLVLKQSRPADLTLVWPV